MSKKIIIAVSLALWLGFILHAQSGKKYSSLDSILLTKFWNSLRTAVNEKNKEKLAALCKFPFTCEPCRNEISIKENPDYVLVTGKIFFDGQYDFFFNERLREVLKEYKMPGDLFVFINFDAEGKKDKFSFSFPLIPPSKTTEGIQTFISVKKIKGEYKIVSLWNVP